jgi:putative flippase GtrA
MSRNPAANPASNPISQQLKPSGQGTAAGVNLPSGFPRALKIGFWFCIVIAVAVVIRRVVALSTPPSPNAPPQLAGLDVYFAAHATLTYIHILCALVFVLLLPLLFWRRTRNSVTLGRVIFPLGLIVGITAYAMSTHAVGGWLERAAVISFNTLFLFALYRAWSYAHISNRPQQQRWMLRAIAILLGIATTRPVMGVFFATARLTHLTPAQFFGIAFWIGFSLNTVLIELWLRTRGRTAFA